MISSARDLDATILGENANSLAPADRPAVVVAPPLIFASLLAGGLLAGRATAGDDSGRFARTIGVASVVAGAVCGGTAFRELATLRTTSNPFAGANALATGGPFALSRNPAYVGATAIYLGAALVARSLPALVMLPVALALLDRLVVTPEERYLDAASAPRIAPIAIGCRAGSRRASRGRASDRVTLDRPPLEPSFAASGESSGPRCQDGGTPER